MMLGAHCSATRQNNFGIDRAVELGCETAQIFGSNKIQWRPKSYTDSAVGSFREAREEAGLGPIFSHAIYLINLGAKHTKPEIYEKSIRSLSDGLQICDLLGLDGLVVHLGSNYGLGLEGSYRLGRGRPVAGARIFRQRHAASSGKHGGQQPLDRREVQRLRGDFRRGPRRPDAGGVHRHRAHVRVRLRPERRGGPGADAARDRIGGGVGARDGFARQRLQGRVRAKSRPARKPGGRGISATRESPGCCWSLDWPESRPFSKLPDSTVTGRTRQTWT